MGLDEDELAQPETADREWVNGFIAALKQENINQIMAMLDQDAVLVSDGGGKATVAAAPIVNREPVAQFLLGPVRRASLIDGVPLIEIRAVNGQPGIILRSDEGIHTVMLIHVEDNQIHHLYVIRNPDKLTYC